MRLFPNEWEGLTPLLPKSPEALTSASRLSSVVLVGTFVGASYGLCKKGFTKVLWRKYYQQQPTQHHAVWSTMGKCAGTFAAIQVASDWALRSRRRHEASAILKDAGIEMPKFRLWESTTAKKLTIDEVVLAVGFTTTITSLALQRLRPVRMSGWALLGQTSLAISTSYLATRFINRVKDRAVLEQYETALAVAANAYTARTGKPAPKSLYSFTTNLPWNAPQGENLAGVQQAGWNFIQHSAISSPGSPPDNLQSLGFPEAPVVEPQPHGLHPHSCVLVDGSLVFGPMRDYHWEPDSTEAGIKTLKEHVEILTEKRTRLAQEAACLFQEVAKRESKYQAMDITEHDTEAGRRSRKAMELLSSMHFNTYSDIAALDWLISDSKKILLQLETNGTWMPKSQGPPDQKVLGVILEQVRLHQKKTELLQRQLGSLLVTQENQAQVEEDIREVKENAEATADLVEYYEEISKPR